MGITNWVQIGRMDELARQDTPMHRLDARAKALVTFAFVVVVMSFPRLEVSALTPMFLFPVAVMAVGRIPARDILKKLLVAAPFALIIGIFNPLLDREPAAWIGPVAISGGWLSFASLMMRFLLTVSAALALIAVTGMVRLGAGLERLGMPRVFAVQLLFLYRYLFVVADQGAKVIRGVELRGGAPRSLGWGVYGSLVGHLLLRSMDRADRVHRAMIARGFDGEIRVLRQSSMRWTDWAYMSGCLVLFAAARYWDLADAVGLATLGETS